MTAVLRSMIHENDAGRLGFFPLGPRAPGYDVTDVGLEGVEEVVDQRGLRASFSMCGASVLIGLVSVLVAFTGALLQGPRAQQLALLREPSLSQMGMVVMPFFVVGLSLCGIAMLIMAFAWQNIRCELCDLPFEPLAKLSQREVRKCARARLSRPLPRSAYLCLGALWLWGLLLTVHLALAPSVSSFLPIFFALVWTPSVITCWPR